MDKHEVAAILDEIGVLLTLQGENPFRIRAYHNAARAIEALGEDLETLVREERLSDVPGIGERIAKKVETLMRTGKLPYYNKLKRSIPPTLLELLKLPGLGGKKVKLLYSKLKIRTMADLLKACKAGKVAKLAGFGKKTQDNILNGIGRIKTYGRRLLWWNAEAIALPILEEIRALKYVERAEVAGSLRRALETVGDLDFLIATNHPKEVMRACTQGPWVSKVLAQGPSKSSVRLKQGMQADFRVIDKGQYAFALMYFTGSKEHNIKMRQRANHMGWSLSEYGLDPLKGSRAPKRARSEAETFRLLKLPYIPPEIREDAGEIEAAEKNRLPKLIEEKDLRGALHCHTTESDGHNTLEEMVRAAEELGWEYIGIGDHSRSSFQANGMDEKRLFAQVKTIDALNRSKKFSTFVFAGLECDILTNGKLDFPDSVLKELDYVVASVHRSFNLSEMAMTQRIIKAIENPYVTILGHVTGRLLLKRDPYAVNLSKVIDACIANGTIMELNAHPMRLDMDWRLWHRAKDKGLKCCINPDAHSTNDLVYVRAGVNIARKGWLEKRDVVNALPLAKMQALLRKGKK